MELFETLTSLSLLFPQPRSQGLSSLPPLVVETETLVAAGHVTIQNLGGRKTCWKGEATGFFIVTVSYMKDQMYLSTHPPCGFGWIDGHNNTNSPYSADTY